jgi:hypothetical protein
MISVFAGQNWTTMPLTQWMATAQLRLLTIFGCQLISDTVQQLDYTLLWILLESVDKCPRHSTRGLGSYRGIRTWRIDQNSEGSNMGGGRKEWAYEVWSPDHIITSAGDVFVAIVLL